MHGVHDRRVDVEPVAYKLDRRARRQRRADETGLSVVQRLHAVEKVRGVRRARVKARHRLGVIGGAVPEGDGAHPGRAAYEVQRAVYFRRDGDEPHLPAGGVVYPLEHVKVRRVEVVRVLRAALGVGDERTFKMYARDPRAPLRADKIAHALRRAYKLRLLERHRRGAKARHAICRVVFAELFQPLGVAVARVRADSAVRVHVDKTGDDVRAMHVLPALAVKAADIRVKIQPAGNKTPVPVHLRVV